MSSTTAANTNRYRVVNPATGDLLDEFPTASDAAIQEAIAAAHTTCSKWSQRPVAERAGVLSRTARLFADGAEDLALIIAEEMGKALDQGIAEARFCADIFDYFAENAESLTADQAIPSLSGGRAVIRKQPLGALLGIMPWNYPYYQVARFIAPNLLLGNTILLKHAESCPRSALAIQRIMDEAGVPQGAYVNVFASHDQVATIIADRRVRGVSLTGSARAGATVARLAGENLKKIVLELGGSDPYVVLDTDDVPASASTAWQTRMENMGQACNSNKRIIVAEDIFDDFVATLVGHARELAPGDPKASTDSTYGPMSSRAAAEALRAQVDEAVSKGATLHVGGELVDGPGAYFAPAVLTGVTPEMRAYREELFGPVAVVYKARDEKDALRMANDTEFGLGAAVFSNDPARAGAFAQLIESGMVSVNTPAAEGAELPFGGTKHSGYGRELGPLGTEEFVNKQLLYIAEFHKR